MIGQTISHYHVMEKLSGWGMGAVYQAEDTKLRRFLAVNSLAEEIPRNLKLWGASSARRVPTKGTAQRRQIANIH
ncbi:MAG: hypothetical protein ABSG53_32365 [Thermoguttaceae bacterium]